MPPEQAAGEEVGPAADIYSLGATLYMALTGKPPFEASTLVELLLQVAEQPPRPPHQRDPQIPFALSEICLRCLAKKPEDRYATARELAEDLGSFLAGGASSKGT